MTKVLFKVIRENLPKIIKSINDNIKKCNEELDLLGEPMPLDDAGKLSLLWNMLNEFCDIFGNVLRGKYDNKRLSFLKDEGGYKIKKLFKNLLDDFTQDYKATADYSDQDINYALTIHEGDSIPGFPSVDAFYYLLRPQLEMLREPINDCFSQTFEYLESLAQRILDKSFSRFPRLIDDMGEFVSAFLNQEREKAKYLVEQVVDMEISYLFTNDYEYMANYTTFVPKNKPIINPNKPLDTKTIFIREIRNRIEAYFKLIVRNLRDSMPKTIGYNLVKSIQDNMQIDLYNQLYKSNEMIASLNEPEEIARRRKELVDQIKVMKDAQKVIRRDPDLMSVMQININDNDIAKNDHSKLHEDSKKIDDIKANLTNKKEETNKIKSRKNKTDVL